MAALPGVEGIPAPTALTRAMAFPSNSSAPGQSFSKGLRTSLAWPRSSRQREQCRGIVPDRLALPLRLHDRVEADAAIGQGPAEGGRRSRAIWRSPLVGLDRDRGPHPVHQVLLPCPVRGCAGAGDHPVKHLCRGAQGFCARSP